MLIKIKTKTKTAFSVLDSVSRTGVGLWSRDKKNQKQTFKNHRLAKTPFLEAFISTILGFLKHQQQTTKSFRNSGHYNRRLKQTALQKKTKISASGGL